MRLNENSFKDVLVKVTGDSEDVVTHIIQHMPLDVLKSVVDNITSENTDKMANARIEYDKWKAKLGESFQEGKKMNTTKLWLTVKNGYRTGGLKSIKESLKNVSQATWSDIWPKMGKPMLIDLYAQANKRTTTINDYSLTESFLANEVYKNITGGKMKSARGILIPTQLAENISNKSSLINKGYTHYVSLSRMNTDKFMDFLESNNIKYLADLDGNFNIKISESKIDKVNTFLEATDENNINAPRWEIDSKGQYKSAIQEPDHEVDMGDAMDNKVTAGGRTIDSLLDDDLFAVDGEGNIHGKGEFKKTGDFKSTKNSDDDNEGLAQVDGDTEETEEDSEPKKEPKKQNFEPKEKTESKPKDEDETEDDSDFDDNEDDETEEPEEKKKKVEEAYWPSTGNQSKPFTFGTFIEDQNTNEEITVTVVARLWGGYRGIRDPYQREQDENRGINILSITGSNGIDYDFDTLDVLTQERIMDEAGCQIDDEMCESEFTSSMSNMLKNAGIVSESTKKQPSKHNPMAKELGSGKYSPRIEKSKKEKDKQNDPLDRSAKHKKDPELLQDKIDEDFKYGDEVTVCGESGTIKIPNGPAGTVGVAINGKVKMFDKEDVHLTEGVIGMVNIPNLNRMRELAGLRSGPAKLTEFSTIEGIPEMPGEEINTVSVDDAEDYEPLPSELPFDDEGEMPVDMPTDEFGDDMDDIDMDIEPDMDSGMPGSIGSDPVEEIPEEPLTVVGDAYTEIQNHLNGIQRLMPDVRLSEYKLMIQRLEEILQAARSSGKTYLGETILRKEK